MTSTLYKWAPVALAAALLLPVAPPAARAAPPEAPAAGALTRPPELLTFVEATLPPEETVRTGAVILRLVIEADGSVSAAEVQESPTPTMGAAAATAAQGFRFRPAEVDGAPARVRILYRYDFTEKVELPTTAAFEGVVRDRQAKVPLPGVTVRVVNGPSAVTDADGRFQFSTLPPGPITVELEGERLTRLSTEETLVAGERLEATYDVFLIDPEEEGDDLEILVSAPTLKKQAVSVEIDAEQARIVPGTQGDVLRVVENMPGVARSSLGSGALVVWGAAPEDTGVYIDGVRVPRLYHDGGLRSVLSGDFVRTVELVPGGYGAAHGRGIGGLVIVDTQTFSEDEGLNGTATADLYDAGGSLHGRVGERLSLGVGGRRSHVGPLLERFSPEVEDLFPVPHYWDLQARAGVRLRANEDLDITFLGSGDDTARTAPNPDPSRESAERRTLQFQRLYLRYTRDTGAGQVIRGLVFVGADQSALVTRYGAVETALRSDTRLIGARVSSRHRVGDALSVEAGFDAEIDAVDVDRAGALAVPAREGDIRAFGQAPPDQINADSFAVVTVNAAPYAEADLGLAEDRLHLIAGLRVDPYARAVSRSAPQEGLSPTHGLYEQDLRREPRLTVRWTPTPRSSLMAAWGRYGQQPQPGDLSASFGNPTLPAATAVHRVVGAGLRPIDPLHIDLVGFSTEAEGIATRSTAEQPARAEALLPIQEARSYGAQLMARLDPTGGLYGWLSSTVAWAERRVEGGEWRPSDYDQRVVLTALGGAELPWGLNLGLRARVATGLPRTEVVGALYDPRRDLYQPLFGAQNELRLPTFFSADLRFAKTVMLPTSALELSLEVQNLTNRSNTEELPYTVDYTERGQISGMPLLPVLGLRWSF